MSTLVTSNISDGTTSVGTGYVVNGSAKSWCHFNGTGTIAINDSLNASTLIDHGVGDYTSNWSNSFSNATYATSGHSFQNCRVGDQGAGYLRVTSAPYYGASHADADRVSTVGIGDLA